MIGFDHSSQPAAGATKELLSTVAYQAIHTLHDCNKNANVLPVATNRFWEMNTTPKVVPFAMKVFAIHLDL